HLHEARPPEPADPARLHLPLERPQRHVGLGADLAERQSAPRIRRLGECAATFAPIRRIAPDFARQHREPLLPSKATPVWTGEVRFMNAMRFHITTTTPDSRLAAAAAGRVATRIALAS